MTRGIKHTPESFWAMGVRVGPCLEWPLGKSSWGYGRLAYHGKDWTASRLAWTLTHGPIPEGMNVLHTCDNPACFEPLHLFLGTLSANQIDARQKGRCHNQTGTTLTADQVETIRSLVRQGLTHTVIAGRFGIARSTVTRIASGARWGKVA